MSRYDNPREVFVIVVEVDHLRARAAYSKGLQDLEQIWPAVMEYAAKTDDFARQKKEEQKKREAEEDAKYNAAFAQYLDNLKAWESSFIKGRYPMAPFNPAIYRPYGLWEVNTASSYQSIKTSLTTKLNLAEAAQGPFKMTEYDVAEMIGWENGTRIDGIKKTIAL